MAGQARYTALFDACVLYPIAMCDALMSISTTGLFAAKWTRRIEDEWIRALESSRPELTGKLTVRRDSMREAVPDWEVPQPAWNSLVPTVEGLGLPDRGDSHVIAAAIAGHADCIVTTNLKHFPASVLDLYGIEAVDPDRFIVNQWDLDALAVVVAFKAMRARWKKPEATSEDFASILETRGLPATAMRLRDAAGLI
jgi:hypothetical protein